MVMSSSNNNGSQKPEGNQETWKQLGPLDIEMLQLVASGGSSLMTLVKNPPGRSTVYRRKDRLIDLGLLVLGKKGLELTEKGREALEYRKSRVTVMPSSLRSEVLSYLPASPSEADEEADWTYLRTELCRIGLTVDQALRIVNQYRKKYAFLGRLRSEEKQLRTRIEKLKEDAHLHERKATEAFQRAEEEVLASGLTMTAIGELTYIRKRICPSGAINNEELSRWAERQRNLDLLKVNEELMERIGKEVVKHEGDPVKAFEWLLQAQLDYGTLKTGLSSLLRAREGLGLEVEGLQATASSLRREENEKRKEIESLDQEAEEKKTEVNHVTRELETLTGVKGNVETQLSVIRQRSEETQSLQTQLENRERNLEQHESMLAKREAHLETREDFTALGELVPLLLRGHLPVSRPLLARALRRLAGAVENSSGGQSTTFFVKKSLKELHAVLSKVMRESFIPRDEFEAKLRAFHEEKLRLEASKTETVRNKDMLISQWKELADRRERDLEATNEFLRDPSKLGSEQLNIVLLQYRQLFADRVEVAWRAARWSSGCSALCGACQQRSILDVSQCGDLLAMWKKGESVRISCGRCGRPNLYGASVLLAAGTGVVVPSKVIQ